MLKSKMTFDPDLSDSGKAIFIATMQQKGLPIGVPEPCINEQLYQHANATQIDDDINFESGRGDYFAYLSRCVVSPYGLPFINLISLDI